MKVTCDRCHQEVEGGKSEHFTTGYYEVGGERATNYWAKYARFGESKLCDCCMWCDPGYIADYGAVHHEKQVLHIIGDNLLRF